MTFVQKCAKHDLFMTMACNPKWSNMVENIKKRSNK